MIILASASPRRQELLKLVTENFIIEECSVNESSDKTAPCEYVEELAERKARAVAYNHPKDIIIGADTVVAIDGRILGKPKDNKDAESMLRALSGKTHQVHTGVAVIKGEDVHVFSVATQVDFSPLSKEEISDYIATGEPADKAGAYGVQGYGGKFVKSINGDYFNIVGLPVNRLYEQLKKLGCM